MIRPVPYSAMSFITPPRSSVDPAQRTRFRQVISKIVAYKKHHGLYRVSPSRIRGGERRASGLNDTALQKFYLQVGASVCREHGNLSQERRYETTLKRLETRCPPLQRNPGQNISRTIALKKEILNTLSQHLKEQCNFSTKDARREAKACFKRQGVKLLNNAEWRPITGKIHFQGEKYLSELVPAGQMKLGKQDIFATPYHNRGVCSQDSKETEHAANLWSSRLVVNDGGKPRCLFQGIRHGVLSPYSLPKGSQERQQGSLNRAKEVASAALWLDPDKLHKALAGETVVLRLSSTSLLTPIDLGSWKEKQQLDDQMSAWKTLSAAPVTLSVRNAAGILTPVTVKVEVAAFNFGVNEMSLGKFKLGANNADIYNLAGMAQLFGDDLAPSAQPGGWVGDYLATQPANREQVLILSRQVKTIWAQKAHLQDGGDPYKAARNIALLASEIGVTPCWNCKSGKDRTGMLDAEIKKQAIDLHHGKTACEFGYLDREGQSLMQRMLLKSGNLELQQYNTGAAGNKTLKNNKIVNFLFGRILLRDRIGDSATVEIAKGMSDLV